MLYTYGILILIMLIVAKLSRTKVNNIIYDLPRNGNWDKRDLSKVTDITLHHFAGPQNQSIESAAKFHADKWGRGIAYHIVIRDGEIFQCLELNDKSFHNGYNNTNAVAISVVGNYSEYIMTEADKKAVLNAAKWLKNKIPSVTRFVGHSEYEGATECCGTNTDVNYFRDKLNLLPFPTNYALNRSTIPVEPKWDADN